MSKKHYEALAAALRDARNDEGSDYATFDEGIDAAVERIAIVLRKDNPRFDSARFLKAAGVSE